MDSEKVMQAVGLAGRRALVVGGGYGSGHHAARLLAQAGARVAVADVDGDRARRVAEEIGGHAVVGDVTTAEGANHVVDEAHERLGGLTRLANVVGGVQMAPFAETDMALWQSQLQLNLYQHMLVCHAAGRHMLKEGGGAIALMASVAGFYGARNMSAYGIAKAGVISLTRTLADEWGPFGVRVNAIAPDNNATTRILDRSTTSPEETLARMDASTADLGVPLRRAGRVHEIAGPLLFLLSDLSSYMTGQCLTIDGGLMVHFPNPAVDAAVQRTAS